MSRHSKRNQQMYADSIAGPVLAIGDLHGCYEQAFQLLDIAITEGWLQDRFVVFLGDIVDRGPDTAGTIDLLLDFCNLHPQTTFCCGNHDLSLAKGLGLVDSPHQAYYWRRMPKRNGATLLSYGARDGEELLEKMPDSHKEFLVNMPWSVEHPDYLFVHAGIDHLEPYEGQIRQLRNRDTSLWKPKWLHDCGLAFAVLKDSEKVIVSGHTTLSAPYVGQDRILLDTGAGYDGPLTACLLPEKVLIQIPPQEAGINCTKRGIALLSPQDTHTWL